MSDSNNYECECGAVYTNYDAMVDCQTSGHVKPLRAIIVHNPRPNPVHFTPHTGQRKKSKVPKALLLEAANLLKDLQRTVWGVGPVMVANMVRLEGELRRYISQESEP